ncbi:MAG TPA: ATP-dependent Clp protease proteolytic subunit, partial [Anaerolineaceae bacterium]|nr:ATP-dependent Clp protease proteolytic subunit [Anaerolineaceae bacterium]
MVLPVERMIKLRAWFGVLLIAAWLFGGLLLPPAAVHAQEDRPVVVVMRLEGALTPVMETYLQRGFDLADDLNAELVVIELSTPGGSVDLMDRIIQRIRNYDRPVIVYVSPRGAMAGSAGTLITLAGHLSAMAPETLIGAASPVGSQGEDIGETMETKIKEVMKALARNLTAGRPLAAQFLAEDMIDKAKAVTVDQALQIGLIDIKAVDLQDLLAQANGRVVLVMDQERTLNTTDARVEDVPQNFVDQLLLFLTNPNLVFILLAVGVQAILIELSSPGGWVAGFTGAVMLLLAVYGLGLLPVNWFGLVFVAMAFVLFALDVKAPTHGALTAAGIGSLIAGALILFNSVRVPGFEGVSVPLVILTALVMGASFSVIVAIGVRAKKTPVQMGSE